MAKKPKPPLIDDDTWRRLFHRAGMSAPSTGKSAQSALQAKLAAQIRKAGVR